MDRSQAVRARCPGVVRSLIEMFAGAAIVQGRRGTGCAVRWNGTWHSRQIRRSDRRSDEHVVRHVDVQHRIYARPSSAIISLSAMACSMVRGKPSSRRPPGLAADTLAKHGNGDFVGHERAARHEFTGSDTQVGFLLEVLPEQIAGSDVRRARTARCRCSACVPLPDPGAPRSTRSIVLR